MRVTAFALGLVGLVATVAHAQPLDDPYAVPAPAPTAEPVAPVDPNAPTPNAPPPPVYLDPNGPPPVPPPPPKKERSRFRTLTRVGFSYIYAMDDHLFGANLGLDLMGESPKWSGGFSLSVDLGRTLTNLSFEWVKWGPRFRFQLSPRVRLGFAMNFGALVFQRVTIGSDIAAFTIGPDLDVMVDLVQFSDGRALFLGGNATFAGALFAFQSYVIGFNVNLGFRF